MYLNEFEENIISTFYKNLSKLSGKSLLLKWDSGNLMATFDTCFEDLDDDTEEDEPHTIYLNEVEEWDLEKYRGIGWDTQDE